MFKQLRRSYGLPETLPRKRAREETPLNNEDGISRNTRQRLLSIDEEEKKEDDEGKMDDIDDVGEGDDSIDNGTFY